MKNKHIGSSLASFLDGEGVKEEVDLRAKKKILADQMRAKMQRDGVTVAGLARRMSTSRTVVIRLLDPTDVSFTFTTLAKASQALDLNLLVSLAVKAKERGKSARDHTEGVERGKNSGRFREPFPSDEPPESSLRHLPRRLPLPRG